MQIVPTKPEAADSNPDPEIYFMQRVPTKPEAADSNPDPEIDFIQIVPTNQRLHVQSLIQELILCTDFQQG